MWGNILFLALSLFILVIETGAQGRIVHQPTYAVVTPTKIRPNQNVVVAATILRLSLSNSFTIRAVIRYFPPKQTVREICSIQHTFYRAGAHNLILKTPESMAAGNYTIRVAGYSDSSLEGLIFTNETKLYFDSKQISVFIFTAKPWYSQGQTVLMRVVPLTTELMPVSTTMDVKMVNPTGIVVKEWLSQHSNTGGVLSLEYPLNKHFVKYGTWTIRVWCKGHNYEHQFEVEEFYKPPFNVRVVTPNYMFYTDKALTGKIHSWDMITWANKGNATVKIDFLHSDDSPVTDVKPLLHKIHEFDKSASFMVTREQFKQHLGSETALIGKQLKVTVTVLDWWWNKTSSGYDSTRVFSDEVLLKFLGGRVWTFQPNTPFQIYIVAQRADQSPLPSSAVDRNMELVISTKDSDSGEKTTTEIVKIPKSSVVSYWVKPGYTTERILVTARYGGRLDSQQTLIATRRWTPTNHHMQITTTTKKPKVNTYMIFNVQTNTFIDYIHYYVVSSGNIVHTDRLEMNSRSKLFSIALSRQMAPSARIVAFYVAPDGQIAADSLQFNVDASGLHKFKVGLGRGKDLSSEWVKIGLKSAPLSFVAVAFHRKELYNMGARNSFTWEEVNEEMKTYDDHANKTITHYWKEQGQVAGTFNAPTPSFAHDTNSTFFYSGLYIFTDGNASSVYTTCNRSLGEHPCMDGLTCYTYKQMCDSNAYCASDHRDEMGCDWSGFPGQVAQDNYAYYDGPLNDDRNLWRAKHIKIYQNDVSFGWKSKFTKQSGGNAIGIKASPVGIGWVLNGFALSHEHGLAIAEPVKEPLKMWLYVKVEGQNKVRLGETTSMKVLVVNKWEEPVDVLLSIPASDDYSFMEIDRDDGARANAVDGEQQILVTVMEVGQRLLYIPIEMKKAGSISVPITALSVIGGHKATYKASVDYDGVKDGNTHSYQVDLRVRNAEVMPDLYIPCPERSVAPESDYQLYVEGSANSVVYVMGDIIGVPLKSTNLNTQNMFGKPGYSGGEATFNFAINLYVLNAYRRLAKISSSRIKAVCQTMNVAVQEFLSYMQEDGSFKEFRWSHHSSTWLSATAVEVMVEALQTTDLRDKFRFPVGVINRTTEWLVSNQDISTGIFSESGPVHNRMFHGTKEVEVNGKIKQANFALTALCTMSIHRASLVSGLSEKAMMGVKAGAQFIADHFYEIEDPFEMAIVTYALFVTGKTTVTQKAINQLRYMNRTAPMQTYWSNKKIKPIEVKSVTQDTNLRIYARKGSSVGAYAVTASSYALLAYLDNSEPMADMDSIQRFLQEQRLGIGAFYSTQDTLIAVRALRALAQRNQDRQTYDMTFTFQSDQDPSWKKTIHLDQSNWFDMQSVKLPSHWGTIQTNVKGTGIALVQMKSKRNYNEEPSQLKQPPIKGVFDLGDVQRAITTRGFNHSLIDYKLCPRWNGPGEQSGMAVLEVNLPNGFKMSNWGSQKEVKKKRDTTSIRAGQHLGGLEVFYFDYLNKSDLNCVEFTAFRYYPVANVAEMTRIKVYEYYEPALALFTWYEKVELLKLTVCLVCGSYQCPYCPLYNSGYQILPNSQILILTAVIGYAIRKLS